MPWGFTLHSERAGASFWLWSGFESVLTRVWKFDMAIVRPFLVLSRMELQDEPGLREQFDTEAVGNH